MANCVKCTSVAVVSLSYSKQDLCKNCFNEQFEQRVWKANHDFELVMRGDVIAVGISGGKDSAAMLFILHKMAKRIGEVTLKPILIDEGIEGYRNVAAQNAVELCKTLGYELVTLGYKELFSADMDDVMHKRNELTESGKE